MDLLFQILGLAYFIFALRNLRLAVLFLPLFFPAYLLKFDVGGVPFPLVEVFIYAAALAWVIRAGVDLFKKKISLKDLFAPFRDRFWIAVAGIVLAALISTLITPQSVVLMDGNTVFYGRKIALGILKSWIVAPVLMLSLFAWVMKTGEDMKIALNGYAVSAVILAAWGVFQVLTGQYATPDARASGPFNSANYLALYITPALFYALARLKQFFAAQKTPWWKKFFHALLRRPGEDRSRFFVALLWIAGFFILLFGLLFTKSYAAFSAFFVVCLLWFGMNIRTFEKFPWKTVFAIAGFLLAAAFLMIALDPAKWQLFFQFTARTSSGVRVEIYTIAARLLLEHPLQGIGLGMFPAVYQMEGPRILGQNPYEWNMLHPHNVFLAFWLNLGLLGFASFLWILQQCFKKAWRFLKNVTGLAVMSLEWFHALGLAMLVIILIHGLVDTPFFKNDLALLFWLVVGVAALPALRGKN